MSLDASLKAASSLARHRNVLTKSERLQRLLAEGGKKDEISVLGMPKTGNRKIAVGKKTTAKKEEEDAGKKKKK